MGAARRARRRASGTLTLTMPGSPGGRSAGAAGSLPVSRQAGGWPARAATARVPAGWRRGRVGAGGGDGQQRLGAHGQHGVAAEGAPQPHLVLVQARLALSLLVAFFCGHLLPVTV